MPRWTDWLVVNILKSTDHGLIGSIDPPTRIPVWGVQMYTLQVFVDVQTNGPNSPRAMNIGPFRHVGGRLTTRAISGPSIVMQCDLHNITCIHVMSWSDGRNVERVVCTRTVPLRSRRTVPYVHTDTDAEPTRADRGCERLGSLFMRRTCPRP